MSLGDEWATITPGSAAKLNGVTVTYGSGAYLASLDKTKHKLVVCTSTGSGLTVDHVYLADSTGTTWIDLQTLTSHTHVDSSTGGSLISIQMANWRFRDLDAASNGEILKANWTQTVTSSATIVDDTDGTTQERSIKLLTGATSGSGSTIAYPGLALGFSDRAIYQTKVRFSATTSLAFHTGVGADDVTAADSNTRKFNAEVCTATNGNWFLRSADGTTNSTSDTGTAFTTTRTGVGIEHYPDLGTPRLDLYVASGTSTRPTVFQKTSNIPTGSTTAASNLMKHSLKNSAAADKNVWVYGCRLRYHVYDQWL